ncbi:MAG: molybdopterin-containing oxidoreductase family protein [Candidatus Bathyarchaeota archaeon]
MNVKAFCRICHGRCSLNITIENEKIVKVRPDPNPPLPGLGHICPKGLAIPEILYHPKRLLHPLVRDGERGSGKWRNVSMDEALNLVAEKLKEVREKYGAKSLLIAVGDPKGLELAFAQRFASVYGTPNIATPGNLCHLPRDLAFTFTFGSILLPDYENKPSLMVVWGIDPNQTNSAPLPTPVISSYVDEGVKLMIVNPRKIALTSKSQIWLKPKPGSDGWLALGMLKVMVEEELYDKNFVESWTVGFNKLKEFLNSLTFDELETETWVSRKSITEATRFYAENKSSIILWGNALDHTLDAFQTARAICILRALTGSIDVAGGELLAARIPILRPGAFMLLKDFPRTGSVGDEYSLARMSAFLPRQAAFKAILDEKPYAIKAAIFIGTNPLLTFPNSSKVYEALKKLEFIVVLDLFMTPTAKLADVILPVAYLFEYDEVSPYPPPTEVLLSYPKLVEPPGECLPDPQIICELAKRLGFEKYFWNDYREALNIILKPSGLSFQDLKEKRVLIAKNTYKKFEKEGFNTPSKKIEIYSSRLESLSLNPLPKLSPTPKTSSSYPFILTNYKSEFFTHSAHRIVQSLRKVYPEPLAEISSETASKLGIKEGDYIYIETKNGRIKQKVTLKDDLDPRVVIAAYGWWFPEEENLFSWNKSNINILTDDESAAWTGIGAVNLRGIPCRVYKA